jgi:NAD+ diphosphatase
VVDAALDPRRSAARVAPSAGLPRLPGPEDNPALSRHPTPVDRLALRRGDPGLIDRLLQDPASKVLVTAADRVLGTVGPNGPVALLLSPDQAWTRFPAAAPEVVVASLGRAPIDGAPTEIVLLVLPDDAEPDILSAGRASSTAGSFSASSSERTATGLGSQTWATAREVLPNGDLTDVAVVTMGFGLAAWHLSHRFCPRCGGATVVAESGWVRRCPSCGSQHFPRTDPAVIMAVLDDRDRLLLGRQSRWPHGRHSVLAGFVEPGETLEDAVRRETVEEAGVHVGRVKYAGSESWPMPRSLMVAFSARATSSTITVDGAELSEAAWWSREALGEAFTAGEVSLPDRMSIARRLIEDWYGQALFRP